MAIATVPDVEVALRRPISEGDARIVEKLLDRVELRIRARWRNLSELVALDSVARGIVSQVEAESVARVLRDESGGLYKSETEDGYRYELNFLAASARLDVLRSDMDELARVLDGGRYRSVAPATDGYAAQRYSGGVAVPPPWAFQYGWPGRGSWSEAIPYTRGADE